MLFDSVQYLIWYLINTKSDLPNVYMIRRTRLNDAHKELALTKGLITRLVSDTALTWE